MRNIDKDISSILEELRNKEVEISKYLSSAPEGTVSVDNRGIRLIRKTDGKRIFSKVLISSADIADAVKTGDQNYGVDGAVINSGKNAKSGDTAVIPDGMDDSREDRGNGNSTAPDGMDDGREDRQNGNSTAAILTEATAIEQGQYYRHLLPKVREAIKFLEQFEKRAPISSVLNEYDKRGQLRRLLFAPIFEDDETILSREQARAEQAQHKKTLAQEQERRAAVQASIDLWMASVKPGPAFLDSNLIHKTNKGELRRSKSERDISNFLDACSNLRYVYEPVLWVRVARGRRNSSSLRQNLYVASGANINTASAVLSAPLPSSSSSTTPVIPTRRAGFGGYLFVKREDIAWGEDAFDRKCLEK